VSKVWRIGIVVVLGFVLFGYVRQWFGLLEPEDDFGTAPHFVTTTGHDYWWQYPEVCSRITDFLRQHFSFD